MRHRRIVAILLLMAGTLVPAISVSAQSPQPAQGIGIRLLEAPTARQNDPRARRSIVDHVKPGTAFSRQFEVSNTTDGPRRVQIYAAGADVVGGSFTPADGRTQNELSSWISVEIGQSLLQRDQKLAQRLTVAVPPTATAGERYAVIWAELPPRTPPGGGIAVVNRVGLRVYLSVGTGGEPPTDFVVESLTAERDAESRPVVKATVRNTGGRALDLSGTLKLTDGPGGLSAGPFDARLGTTLALGASEPVTVPLDPALPAGPWLARIELRSGTAVRAASATITFPAGAGTTASPVAATPVRAGRASWVTVLLGLGVTLAVLGLLLLLLRRQREALDSSPALPGEPQPSLDELLEELLTASGKRRSHVLDQAAAYGREAIMASPKLAALPVETARALGERVARTEG